MCSKKMLFSEKIRQLREENKLYQKQLADALSIDKPMYCRIEKGEHRAKKRANSNYCRNFTNRPRRITYPLAC
jgi:transcriptional regulator with XRE-family HTH domain